MICMMITHSMERYYADLLERKIISRERLLSFIQERENCTLEDAEEIQYGVLCLIGDEL